MTVMSKYGSAPGVFILGYFYDVIMNFSMQNSVSKFSTYTPSASKLSLPNSGGTLTGTISIHTIISEIFSGASRENPMIPGDCTITSPTKNELIEAAQGKF